MTPEPAAPSSVGAIQRLLARISGLGLVMGALLMAASLTPSLIPRSDVIQGLLGGVCFAAGYGIAVILRAIWTYLQLPVPGPKTGSGMLVVAALVSGLILVMFLGRSAHWQNSIRALMDMPPVDASAPWLIGALASVVATLLIGAGKAIAIASEAATRRIERVIPPRLARVLGLAVVATLVVLIGNGVLVSGAIRALDRSAQALDAFVQPDVAPPADPLRTGSSASLVAWGDLGREGRNFIGRQPDAGGISAVTGREAVDPVRVYVGLNAASDHTARARLAVEELARVGGFNRGRLVIAMPTGTGWMDPAAFETLEYLHHGDVATVAIQYSHLSSWLSLLVEPEFSIDAGRALFVAVHEHWRTIPQDERPQLYLYGLSLGAYSSQQSMRMHEIIERPISGALWVGPPFVSPLWQTLTAERDPSSPAWLPRLDDGRLVRFTNGTDGLDSAESWGTLRIVYLQYASDPITFFTPGSATRPPEWMSPPRGPDVSSDLRWIPIVSFLQLVFDMAIALEVPIGHGHLYAFGDHVRPWVEVTQPQGWDAESLAALEHRLRLRDR